MLATTFPSNNVHAGSFPPTTGYPTLTDVVHLRVQLGAILPRPVLKASTRPNQDVTQPPRTASPYNWSCAKKQVVVWICCIAAVFASFAASSYAPCKDQLVEEWGISGLAALAGITTFTTGFGLGPMALAPLSEIRGRKPVFAATGALFIVCSICSAVTQSYPGMLVARFFAGVGSSTYSTLVGGVISDIYRPRERNTAMAIFSGGALFGVGLGPLICGFIGQYSTWRWVFWLQVIVVAALVFCFMVFVPETRESILSAQERDALNKWAQELKDHGLAHFDLSDLENAQSHIAHCVQWHTREDETAEVSMTKLISTSLTRPFIMLCTEPIVTYLSLWAAFSWSVLYIALAVVPLMYQDVYGFSLSAADSVFASVCVASVLATFLGIYQERCLDRKQSHNAALQDAAAERRLYFTCVESLFLPLGLFMFGWTAKAGVHWILPTIAIGVATAGIFSIYLSVFNYLADCYRELASSALAAQSACRNIMGGVFPLVTTQLYTGLGYGPGSSMLGGIALLLCLGPWVLFFCGHNIRARSRVAQALLKETS